ncbi:membrane protein insertase YidC [Paralimibaculum aggregatum]|uniref:Membrane protein insertase YidC n=1 Tax=Paralimibaculum aggregatum TaxID=3036245 RepID=A0ABQ6LKX3_9RHOB|nr:membrane protein insertase YidC [Limibaculum sp. NKW23]GMG80935.1 membrane protein insertase YidC [Limibaculum sp. NKW23]
MMGDKDETRNLIIAVALSMLVIVGWYALFPPPEPEPQPAGQVTAGGAGAPAGVDAAAPGTAGGPVVPLDRSAALSRAERIEIETPALSGSIAVRGGRVDDLDLSKYKVSLEPDAATVTLLNPTRSPNPYFVVYGWLPAVGTAAGPLPGPTTDWLVEEGERLTPESPVTLAWDNGEGLIFRRRIAVDEDYMFTMTQSVENTTEAEVALAPYAYIARRGEPDTQGFFILHEGALGVFDGELSELDYDDLLEMPVDPLGRESGRLQARQVEQNGWLGFTDKYWMTVLAPAAGQPFSAVYRVQNGAGRPEFRTEMRLPAVSVAPGTRGEVSTRLFAGAKEVTTISAYEEELKIDKFVDSVDWGWFYFLTKPFFWMLHWFSSVIGNMGWSIILLTLCVKAVLFPLAYKSYVSMSKMKALQPQMEKLKERCGDDKQRMQKEMMELYKREKVNPASGCLPILFQIPIFFALYKVLFVTIEMRHAPFILWIRDLSAPDPSTWMTLFGVFPWDIPAFLSIFSIGVFPILMGITMWLQQKLNPAPTDPTQQMIFAWMPWVFMFMLGQFAVGLVIYWTANNTITIIQQYVIMRSQGVQVDLLGNIKQSFKKKRKQTQE